MSVYLFGVCHEGNGTVYVPDGATAHAVAIALVRDEPEGAVWVERYMVRKLTKGVLLSALGGSGGGWCDRLIIVKTYRSSESHLSESQAVLARQQEGRK